MPETMNELQAYLLEHIPLTRAIGVRVDRAEPRAVSLSAPFEPNVNHRRTIFGGSLAAVAVLAGWSVVRCGLRESGIDAQIVVQRHAMEFLQPVFGDFSARCEVADAAWQRFSKSLARRGRSRIELGVDLHSGGTVVAQLRGEYVAERIAEAEAGGAGPRG